MIWMSILMAVTLVVRTKEYLYRLIDAPSDWHTCEDNIWEMIPYVMKSHGISVIDESKLTKVNLYQVLDEAPKSSTITVDGITDSSLCETKYCSNRADDILQHLKSCYNQLK
eukprot:NODE_259_length_11524_cov_0.251028.p10 type:complete len:112 gc:universal NODE_259_length_11524_cov_0.251028:5215-4880(-)